MITIINPIGVNIRQLRKERGWSARELAERAGAEPGQVTRAIIADIENNRRQDLNLTAAMRIARALDVPIERLAAQIPAATYSSAEHELEFYTLGQ